MEADLGDVYIRAVPCVFPSLTVMLHLVVMLPRHEDAEIRRLDAELADLRRQVDAGRADLVAQHNALAGRRGALAAEYYRLVADANDLIDSLNWARW